MTGLEKILYQIEEEAKSSAEKIVEGGKELLDELRNKN